MNKRYIIRGILIGSMLSVLTGNVKGQELTTDADTTVVSMPGSQFDPSRITNTGSVSTVEGETLYQTATPNLSNTLVGRLSGLTVSQGSGEPGNDNARWLIRGNGSYGFGGYNVCKIYVDGFEVNASYFTNLSAAEIESVSVLKDAASLATFGMRGSNGIIWVETKRGKIGPSSVTAQFRSGVQSATNINKPLDSYNYASLYNQAVSNDNGMVWSPQYSETELAAYQGGNGTNVDWYKQVMKDQGSYLDGDIIFNGGSNDARYNLVFDYANQQGLYDVANTDSTSNIRLEKFSLRANLDFNIFKIFDAKVDLGGRIEERKRPSYGTSGLMNNLANYPSNIYPVYDNPEGTHYSGTSLFPDNPVASSRGLGWYSTHARVLQGNFSLKERLDFITSGLYLQEAFSFNSYVLSTYSKTKNYARYADGSTTTTDQTTTIVASGYGSAGMEDWKQAKVTLGYDHQFGMHGLTAVLNFHQSDFKGDGYFGYKYHYQNLNGRANYNFDNRYVGELAFSYFGSDAYAPGNRWGFYPTISGAWVASNEKFLAGNKAIKFLKIRASVGKSGGSDAGATGNLAAFSSNGRYLYQPYYTGSYIGAFYTGNSTPTWQNTLVPLFIANQDVFAEQSVKYNVGADVNFFGKLDATLDVYMDKRSDILTLDNSILDYYGSNYSFTNVGEMTNKGIEINASYSDQIGELGFTISGMAFYSKNTIDYMAEVAPAYSYNAQTGRAFGTPIGLEAIGLYQLSDFNADGSLKSSLPQPLFGSVQPGDLRYEDLDSDGYVDETDVTAIGKTPYPELSYSFGGTLNYKSFDLSILFQGTYGSSVNLLDNWSQVVAFVDNGNAFDIAKGAWAYYPDQGIDTRATATYPRLTTQENTNNYRSSSYWMKSADFLRIRNVELGYNFTKQLLHQLNLAELRVYVNATNPVTWSSLLDDYNMDPEITSGYPALKSVNVGVKVSF